MSTLVQAERASARDLISLVSRAGCCSAVEICDIRRLEMSMAFCGSGTGGGVGVPLSHVPCLEGTFHCSKNALRPILDLEIPGPAAPCSYSDRTCCQSAMHHPTSVYEHVHIMSIAHSFDDCKKRAKAETHGEGQLEQIFWMEGQRRTPALDSTKDRRGMGGIREGQPPLQQQPQSLRLPHNEKGDH